MFSVDPSGRDGWGGGLRGEGGAGWSRRVDGGKEFKFKMRHFISDDVCDFYLNHYYIAI